MDTSKEYKKQLEELHKKQAFGNSKTINDEIKNIIIKNNIKSILDFGSGKGFFSKELSKEFPNIKIYSYDPITSPIDLPKKVDLIYSSDVLEHIEPLYLDKTMKYFFESSKFQYHLIACHPAKKSLSDGRNAHLIIENYDWWLNKFQEFINEHWRILFAKEKIKIGKTKKLGILEQEKFIIFLQNVNTK